MCIYKERKPNFCVSLYLFENLKRRIFNSLRTVVNIKHSYSPHFSLKEQCYFQSIPFSCSLFHCWCYFIKYIVSIFCLFGCCTFLFFFFLLLLFFSCSLRVCVFCSSSFSFSHKSCGICQFIYFLLCYHCSRSGREGD